MGGDLIVIFELYPWKLDIDLKSTKKLYADKDFSLDKELNQTLFDFLSPTKQEFFKTLEVDFMKIPIEKTIYEIPEEENSEEERITIFNIKFLLRGELLSITKLQKEIYGDGEVFGDQLPSSLEIVKGKDENEFLVYEVDGMPCIFKHPCTYFEGEDFEKWDCGYVAGAILLKLEN